MTKKISRKAQQKKLKKIIVLKGEGQSVPGGLEQE